MYNTSYPGACYSVLFVHRNHFEKKEGMKMGGMFKSPMTIMMIVSFGLMFLLPKMMANMDPEQLEVRST